MDSNQWLTTGCCVQIHIIVGLPEDAGAKYYLVSLKMDAKLADLIWLFIKINEMLSHQAFGIGCIRNDCENKRTVRGYISLVNKQWCILWIPEFGAVQAR